MYTLALGRVDESIRYDFVPFIRAALHDGDMYDGGSILFEDLEIELDCDLCL